MRGDERDHLVEGYLDGSIGRRIFVKRLLASGVSLAAAGSYAELLAGGTARAAAGRPAGPRREQTKTVSGFYNFYNAAFDNHFGDPRVTLITRGDSVSWGSLGAKAHSVTDRSGLGYFDSGFAPRYRIRYDLVFPAAGTYHYHCKDPHHASTMTGTVRVPVGRRPVSAHRGTQFTIFWGQKGKPAPPGYVFDVQIKRPGHTNFAPFRTGSTNPSAHFTPQSAGQFQFRARLRNKHNGKASGWSPVNHITAT